jgi:hypothetical protein
MLDDLSQQVPGVKTWQADDNICQRVAVLRCSHAPDDLKVAVECFPKYDVPRLSILKRRVYVWIFHNRPSAHNFVPGKGTYTVYRGPSVGHGYQLNLNSGHKRVTGVVFSLEWLNVYNVSVANRNGFSGVKATLSWAAFRNWREMLLCGRMWYFTSAATIKQFIDVWNGRRKGRMVFISMVRFQQCVQ